MDQSQFIVPLLLILTVFFLLCAFALSAVNSSLRQIYKKEPKKNPRSLPSLFFYSRLIPRSEFESLFFSTSCTHHVVRFCYAACFVALLFQLDLIPLSGAASWWFLLIALILFLILILFIADLFPRLLGIRYPEMTLRIWGALASLLMILVFPLTYFLGKISFGLPRAAYYDELQEPEELVKQEIIDIIQESNVSSGLDAHERKLIESVVSFRDRIAREVMVPRVNIFSLSANTSIREAANLLQAEGYSRTPVYRNNVDNIIGVLMYKDILNAYMEHERKGKESKVLEAPIESVIKNVLYTPETKKISLLLQEFRKKQVHLAIVVDEYGGTEGIVTIEDILEEIVGEIADEYDEKEALYIPLPDGGWLVDARMAILDAEELLGVIIPQESDYDTIGGYIFHRTGSIPPRGTVIHHDSFDLEIVKSNDRFVEKVRIKPIKTQTPLDID